MVGGHEYVEREFFKRDYEESEESSDEQDDNAHSYKYVFKTTGITEKYYLEDNEWDIIPPVLSQPKAGVALCKFQNRYLYAIGGDNGKTQGGNIVSDIERLDLYEEEEAKTWELLFIKQKQMSSPLAYG